MRLFIPLLALVAACSKSPAPSPAAPTKAPEPAPTKPAEPTAPNVTAEPTRPEPVATTTAAPDPSTASAATTATSTEIAPPTPSGDARAAKCAELAAKTREVTAALQKKVDGFGLPEPKLVPGTTIMDDTGAKPNLGGKGLGECIADASGKGAWIMTVDSADATKDPDPEASDTFKVMRELAFVFVADDGTTRRWVHDDNPESAPFTLVTSSMFIEHLEVARVFDWDDDGLVDLAIRRHSRGPDLDATSFSLVHMVDGAPAEWKVDDAIRFDELSDVDGDGRPDLLRYAPFAWGMREDVVPANVRYLLHSIKGGFATDDAAAKAYYTKVCGGAKVAIGDAPKSKEEGDVMDQIVCARLWGASADATQEKLDAYMKAAYEQDPHPKNDPDDPPFMAKPPVTLP